VERELGEAANRRERRQGEEEIRRLNAELSMVNAELREKIELLSRSTADLEEFAYAASHDLKEPLRNVVTYSQLLLRRFQNSMDEDAIEFAGYIRTGVERMRSLIDGLPPIRGPYTVRESRNDQRKRRSPLRRRFCISKRPSENPAPRWRSLSFLRYALTRPRWRRFSPI
jgi:signal transduction histidine kinase